MKKGLLLIFLCTLFNYSLIAQNNLFSDCGNQVASDDCSGVMNQPTICELDGFVTTTSMLQQDQATETLGFCGNTIAHNNMWIAFTPFTGDVLFEFIIESCQGTPFQFDGLQAAIMQIDCDSGQPATYFGDCQFCSTQTFQIGAQNLTPGVEYFIMLDGCNGDVCGFEIDVIEGLPPAGHDVALQAAALCPPTQPGDPQEAFLVATVTPTFGNYVYEWIGPDGEVIEGATGPTYYAEGVGEYTVNVRDITTCCPAEAAASVVLADNAPIAAVATSQQLPLINCTTPEVLLDGSASTFSGNVTYAWFSPNGSNLGNGNLTAVVDEDGTYTFAIFQNEFPFCLSEVEIEVEINDIDPVLTNTLADITIDCDPATSVADFVATATSANDDANFSYSWLDSGGDEVSDMDAFSTSNADTYTLIVTDEDNGCTDEIEVDVVNSAEPPTALAGDDDILNCTNLSSIDLTGVGTLGTATSGTLTYQWIDSNGDEVSDTEDLTATTPDTYTLIVTNTDNGCSTTDEIILTQETDPPADVTATGGTLTCTDTDLMLTGSSTTMNVEYEWIFPGMTETSSDQNPVISTGGEYELIVTDPSNGCTANAMATVLTDAGFPSAIPNNIGTSVAINCNDSQVEYEGTSDDTNATITWLDPDDNDIGSSMLTATSGGIYTLVVSSTNGCTSTSTVDILEDVAIPDLTATGGIIYCNPDEVEITASSTTDNTDFSWTGPDIIAPGGGSQTVGVSGTYNVVVTNTVNGCTDDMDVMVTEDITDPDISIAATTTVLTCTEDMITLDGNSSTGGVDFQWSGGSTAVTDDVTATDGGTYTLLVTNSTNGCTAEDMITLTEDKVPPMATADGTLITCTNPNTQLTAGTDATNATFAWSNGTTGASSTANAGGMYTVIVTNEDNSCTNEATVTVLEDNDDPNIMTEGGNINCIQTTVELQGSSTTGGVNFNWTSDGGFTSADATPTVGDEGTYTLLVTNPSNGCTSEESVMVAVDMVAPSPNAGSPMTLTCTNMETVELDGSASTSNSGNLTYQWQTPAGSNLGTNMMQEATASGTYTLIVTDEDNGCTESTTVEVDQNIAPPQGLIATGGTIDCISGFVEITGNSSTPNVSYEWTFPGGASTSNNQNENVTSGGTYTLEVTNNINGCTATETAVVDLDDDIPSATFSNIGTAVAINCNDSQVEYQGMTNDMSATIEWFDENDVSVGTGSMLTATSGGDYTLVVTSLNGCSSDAMVSVLQDMEQPDINALGGTITCDPGTVVLTAASTVSSVDFNWTGPPSSIVASGGDSQTVSIGGTYNVVVTNTVNGCTNDATVMAIEDVDDPMVTVTSQSGNSLLTCTEPQITLDAQSPTAGVNYSWSNLDTNASIDVVDDGVYSVVVTNPTNSCTSEASITIDENFETPVATADGEIITCDNPASQLMATSDIATVNYAWSGGTVSDPSVADPTTMEDGMYTVLITNTANGCTDEATYEVMENTVDPEITAAGGTITCTETSIALTGGSTTNDAQFGWTYPDGVTTSIMSGPTVTDVGFYTLIVTDPNNGCTSEMTIEVMQDENLPIATTTGNTIDCINTDVEISADIETLNTTFEWTAPNGVTTFSEINPTVDEPGAYTLVVTATNGCSSIFTSTVVDDTASPETPTTVGGVVDCVNTEIMIEGASTTSDVTYAWTGPNGFMSIDQNPMIVDAGTYTVEVTGLNGCTSMEQAVVTSDVNPPGASATADGSGFLNCNNTMSPIIGSSSTPNVTFEWTYPDGVTTSTNEMETVDMGGVYTLLVTSLDNGCVSESTVELFEDFEEPGAMASGGTITCATGSTQIVGETDANNAAFSWTGPGVFSSNISNPSVDTNGDYILTVTGTNGCTSTATALVMLDAGIPDVAAVTDILNCDVLTVPLDGTGSGASTTDNVLFSWTDENGNIVGSEIMSSATEPGIYNLLVTNDDNGCTNSISIEVEQNIVAPIPDAGMDDVFTCSTTSLTLDANNSTGQGNLSYGWFSSMNAPLGSASTLEILGAGEFTVVVTDAANGCTASDVVDIEPDMNAPTSVPIIISVEEVLTCDVQSVTVDGSNSTSVGGTPLSYQWQDNNNNDIANANTFNTDFSEPGTYYLVVTDMSNGCNDIQPIEITQDIESPMISLAAPEILTCMVLEVDIEGTASSSNSNDFSYEWASGSGAPILNGTSATAQVSEPGPYILSVTNNDNGCVSNTSLVVNEQVDLPLAVPATALNEFTCTEFEVTLDATGSSAGNDFVYTWTGPTTSSILSGVNTLNPVVNVAGDYQLLITNEFNGCTQLTSINVPENDSDINDANIEPQDEDCFGDNNGIITITDVDGGTGPYLYSLNGEALGSSATFTGLEPGVYEVAVEDTEGCTYDAQYIINPGNDVTVVLDAPEIINLGDSTMIEADVNINPNEIQSVIWSDSTLQGQTPSVTPLITTTYTATVIDENGCTDTQNITIFVTRDRKVFVPNAFNPEGETQANNVLGVFSDNSVENIKTFKVFDRWGSQLYEANNFLPNDPNYGWDGTYNGKTMKPAVFVWYAEIEFKDGVTEIFKGDSALIYK